MQALRKAGATIALAAVLVSGNARAQDWKQEWDAARAAAKGQQLNLILHSYEAHEAVAREFQKKFPDIRVNVTAATPSSTAPRLVTEQKNGIYNWDSWWASTGNMNSIVLPAGGFDPITDYLILPEVKEPSNWQRPDMLYTSSRGPFILVHSYYYQGAGFWNTSVVKGFKLETPESLLDPRLVGKINIEDPRRSNGGSNAMAALLKLRGPDFVNSLFTKMQPTFMSITRQLTDAVSRGDAAIIFGGNPETMYQCWNAGGCRDVRRVTEFKYVLARGVAVFKNAPNKAATKVWINWLLSKEGQESYVQNWANTNKYGAVSLRADVAPHPDHQDSVPEYSRLDQFVSVATDSGAPVMEEVYRLYSKVQSR
jgi:ABC-type Fe3+ transport system substrate-binding protein